MTKEEIEKVVRNAILETEGYCDEDLSGMSFGVNVDSLSGIEIIMKIEDEMNFEILHSELANIRDASQLVDFLCNKQEQK